MGRTIECSDGSIKPVDEDFVGDEDDTYDNYCPKESVIAKGGKRKSKKFRKHKYKNSKSKSYKKSKKSKKSTRNKRR